MVYKVLKRKMISFGFLILCNIAVLCYIEYHISSKKNSKMLPSFHHALREHLSLATSNKTTPMDNSRHVKRKGISTTKYQDDNHRLSKNMIKIMQLMNEKYCKVFGKSAADKVLGANKVDIRNDYYPFVDFKFVFPEVSPKGIYKEQKYFMIILVNSGAKGEDFRKRRETIRQTWGNRSSCEQRKALEDESLKDLKWLLVFVVGKAGPGSNDDELNKYEARKHNDMLIGNITDNYINNIIKFYMGQVWASRFDVKYTMKTDDDVYVRIPRVLEYLVNAKFPRPFYGGMTYPEELVDRVIGGKWTVSWKYYEEKTFPRFNPGAFFILSSDLLNKLFNYVYIRKPFHTDDAYVGVAMRDFKVNTTRINSFRVGSREPIFIRTAKDCEMLGYSAFGHSIDPQSARELHRRLQSHLCKNITLKC